MEKIVGTNDLLKEEIRQAAKPWIGKTFREVLLEHPEEASLPERTMFRLLYEAEKSYYSHTHKGWEGHMATAGPRILNSCITEEKVEILVNNLAEYIRSNL